MSDLTIDQIIYLLRIFFSLDHHSFNFVNMEENGSKPSVFVRYNPISFPKGQLFVEAGSEEKN